MRKKNDRRGQKIRVRGKSRKKWRKEEGRRKKNGTLNKGLFNVEHAM